MLLIAAVQQRRLAAQPIQAVPAAFSERVAEYVKCGLKGCQKRSLFGVEKVFASKKL